MAEVKFLWKEPISIDIIRKSWELAFKRSTNDNAWKSMFNWRFLQNPGSQIPVAAYILENDEIACFYAVSPLDLYSPKGRTIKSGLMNMGFTNPNFQGKGYYLEVNQKMHAELQNQGYEILFGFANHNSHYTYRKYLGWQDLGLLTNFSLDISNIKENYRKSEYYKTVYTKIDMELVDLLDNFIVTENKYHAERGKDFLYWRLVKNPYHTYKSLFVYLHNDIVACVIFKDYQEKEADIMEIFYLNNIYPYNKMILPSVIRSLIDQKYKIINIWSNLHSEEHLFLEKLGFVEETATTYFGIIKLKECNDMDNINNWHYRFIDSDVY